LAGTLPRGAKTAEVPTGHVPFYCYGTYRSPGRPASRLLYNLPKRTSAARLKQSATGEKTTGYQNGEAGGPQD
jgi:hypothetical protein